MQEIEFVRSRILRRLQHLLLTMAAVAGLAIATGKLMAFTSADADTIMNSFNNAFYIGNNGNGYFKGNQGGGDTGFWVQAELIEAVEDANVRTGGTYNSMVTSLLNGFSAQRGTNWSGNQYNDDIAWACIAYLRGYQATGNVTFRNIAKQNFDMMYARAWNTSFRGGGLWWKYPDNNSKNACIQGPGAIAAYLLYQTLGDAGYLTKSQSIFNWLKGNLYDASNGAVWDAVNTSNSFNYWSSSYNQGTFIGAAHFLGDVPNATLAANFMTYAMGDYTPSGYKIMPQYGTGGGDLSGFNSVGLRWLGRFMKDRGLQKNYLGWLQANANAAWAVRRTSDNLSWCQFRQQTPAGTMYAWDCVPAVVALQVAATGDTPNRPYFMIVNRSTGKALDLIGGSTSDGAVINQWSYDYNGPNQRWTIVPTGNGHHQLISWVSGRSACIQGDSTAAGAQLHSWWYTGNNPGQQFDFIDAGNGWHRIRNVKSGLVLEVANGSTADNAKVQQAADVNGLAQQWRLQPWGDYFVLSENGKAICVENMANTNGARIIQYTRENNPWFKWRFTNKNDGWYGCHSLHALNKVISVHASSTAAAHYCHLWDYNAANGGDQKVRLRPMTDGTYKFYFGHTGMSWDIPGGATGNNVELQQYPDNGFGWQTFVMFRVP